ncbi:MAG: MarR family winged helix-turn-helix transcriptional regulator [Terriglobia bacterium]
MKSPAPIEADLLFLVYDVGQQIRRLADKRARTYGMTRAQWAVLARLEREPGTTQSRLAVLTDVEPITIGRLIDRLERSGLIERQADPNDRRVWRLKLTPKAGPILKQIATFRRELHEQMSEGLDRKSLDGLIRSLQRVRSSLTARETGRNKRTSTP